MNVLFEIVRQSLATLWAHKLRSFLTMFGIAWGVGSLLLLVGLGKAFAAARCGTWLLLVRTSCLSFRAGFLPWRAACSPGRPITLPTKITPAIRNEARTLRALSPVINREDIRAVSDYGSTNGQVFGVSSGI